MRRMTLTMATPAIAVVGALTIAVAALTPSVDAQTNERETPVVESSRQITTDPNPARAHALPQIAVHPTEPSVAAVAVGDARNGGCALHVTTDGGRSWGIAIDDMLPDDTDFCVGTNPGSYLDLEFASDGTLYVAFFAAPDELRAEGADEGVLLRTDDLGATHQLSTFAEPTPWTYDPDDGPEEDGRLSVRNPRVAVHPDDPEQVYVTTSRRGVGTSAGFREADNRTHVVASDDGGSTWSDPFDVTDLVEDELDEDWVRTGVGKVQVAPDGTVYVVVNGESTFFLLTSTDEGASWAISEIGEGSAGAGGSAVTGLDADRGHLYVVWHQRTGDEDDFEPAHVYMYRSADAGETWDARVNLTADDAPAGFSQYHPGMSVAPDGRVDVAWYEFRNDPGFDPDAPEGSMGTQETETHWDVYSTSSEDGGETWAPATRVSDRSVSAERGSLFANFDVIGSVGVASTDQAMVLTWSDTRASDDDADAEDAYFTQVRLADDASATAPAMAVRSNALWGGLGAAVALTAGGVVLLLTMRVVRRSGDEPADARGQSGS